MTLGLIWRVGPVPSGIAHTKKVFSTVTGIRTSCSLTIDNMLIKMIAARSYDEIPDRIGIDYEQFNSNTNFNDLSDLLNLQNKLAATKFGKKIKQISLSGYARDTISQDTYTNIINSGFSGCAASSRFGLEAAKDSWESCRKDNSFMDSLVVPRSYQIIATDTRTKQMDILLSFRQQQILHLIKTKGLTNNQMAKQFDISEQAVKLHVSIILKKYGVRSRTQLVLLS